MVSTLIGSATKTLLCVSFCLFVQSSIFFTIFFSSNFVCSQKQIERIEHDGLKRIYLEFAKMIFTSKYKPKIDQFVDDTRKKMIHFILTQRKYQITMV